MKRIVALALAFVLCFSLAACAAEPASVESKYAELEKMLDEGRYGDAMTYILSLQAQNSSSVPLFVALPGDGTYTDEDLDTDKEPDAEVLALIDELMGEWVIATEDEDHPQKVVLRKDGTCTVDGTEMTWKREATKLSDNTFDTFLSVWEGEVERCQINQPTKSDAGELSFTIGKVEGISIGFGNTRYICPDHYEAVELTMDNWQEYFEFTEKPYHDTNAFGDVTSVGRVFYFALKKPYYNRLSSIKNSSGDVEIGFTAFTYEAQMNEDGTTYTVGAWYREDAGYHSPILTLGKYSGTDYWGTSYHTSRVHTYNYSGVPAQGTPCFCDHVDDINVLRIQGTIYLLKEQ